MRGLAETILVATDGQPVVRRATVLSTADTVWPVATVQVGGVGGDIAEDIRVLAHVWPLAVDDEVLLERKADGWLITGHFPDVATPGALSIDVPAAMFIGTLTGWQNVRNIDLPGDPKHWWKLQVTGTFSGDHTVDVVYGCGFGRVTVIAEAGSATARLNSSTTSGAGRIPFATHELYSVAEHGQIHLATYRSSVAGTQQFLNVRISAIRLLGPPTTI